MPWSNSFLEPTPEAVAGERKYPLKVMVCLECLLVQTTATIPPEEIFNGEYAYHSSYSASWLAHAKRYVEYMAERYVLGSASQIIEVASNDGYLLQYFAAKGIPVLGIEPAANAAKIAEERGIPSEVAFFGRETAVRLAERGIQADLIAANNVLAHVPDIADFVSGFPLLLKRDGVTTFEFPHLLRLLESTQFDTIYHEHYSYLSLLAVERIFGKGGLQIFDVEELPTHGGSLRVYAQRQDGRHRITNKVAGIKGQEKEAGLNDPQKYADFQSRITEVCEGFKAFLDRVKQSGKQMAAYGAAAKGNTFLNYCDVSASDISFVADRSVIKQGKLLPGSHIPVKEPGYLQTAKPDYVLILPWNLAAEVSSEYASIHSWGGRFAVAVPEMRLL